VVNASTLIHDVKIALKGILTSGLTDPISATRPATDKFVLLGYPDRATTYPHVIITHSGDVENRLTFCSGVNQVNLEFEISIFSKSTKQADEIYDNIKNIIRNSIGSVHIAQMNNPKFLGGYDDFSLSEGREGVHQKVITYGLTYEYV